MTNEYVESVMLFALAKSAVNLPVMVSHTFIMETSNLLLSWADYIVPLSETIAYLP